MLPCCVKVKHFNVTGFYAFWNRKKQTNKKKTLYEIDVALILICLCQTLKKSGPTSAFTKLMGQINKLINQAQLLLNYYILLKYFVWLNCMMKNKRNALVIAMTIKQ